MKYLAKILIAGAVALLAQPVLADDKENPILDRCFAKWGADYEMTEYCFKQQFEAAVQLKPIYQAGMWDSVTENILWPCIQKWERDYEMQLYCYQNQRAAYDRLHKGK